MKEKLFHPDLTRDLAVTTQSEPEVLYTAVGRELEPLFAFIRDRMPKKKINSESVKWILNELIVNGIRTPIAKALEEQTGLSQQILLEQILPGELDSVFSETYDPGNSITRKIESAMDDIPSFRTMSTAGRYQLLGLSVPDYLPVVCVRVTDSSLEILIRFKGTPSPEQQREIMKRFEDYDCTRAEIKSLRKKHATAAGRFHIPSFTGGGGFGLLQCIRNTRKIGLYFEYVVEELAQGFTTFKIGTCKPTGKFWFGKGERGEKG